MNRIQILMAIGLLTGLILAWDMKRQFSKASGNWFPRTVLGFGVPFVIFVCFAIFKLDGGIRLTALASFLALYLPMFFIMFRQHWINRRMSDGANRHHTP